MSIGDLVPWHTGRRRMPVRKGARTAVDRSLTSLFDEILGGVPLASASLFSDEDSFIPRVNVKDTPEALIVSAELPGLEEKEVDITLTHDSLVLRGEKTIEKEESEKEGYHYVERRYGSFQRMIPLNFEVDEDKVEATFINGVVNVILPKSEMKSSTKKISVKSS